MMDEPPLLQAVLDHYGVRYRDIEWEQTIRCPLGVHDDNRPSASLNLGKQVWRCHACDKGGDAYTVLMERENVRFVEAKRYATGLVGDSNATVLRGDDAGGGVLARRQGARSGGGRYRFTWGGG